MPNPRFPLNIPSFSMRTPSGKDRPNTSPRGPSDQRFPFSTMPPGVTPSSTSPPAGTRRATETRTQDWRQTSKRPSLFTAPPPPADQEPSFEEAAEERSTPTFDFESSEEGKSEECLTIDPMPRTSEDIVGWLSEHFGTILKKPEAQIAELIIEDMGIRNRKDMLALRQYNPEKFYLHFGAKLYDANRGFLRQLSIIINFAHEEGKKVGIYKEWKWEDYLAKRFTSINKMAEFPLSITFKAQKVHNEDMESQDQKKPPSSPRKKPPSNQGTTFRGHPIDLEGPPAEVQGKTSIHGKPIPDDVSVDLSEASSYQPSYATPDPASMCDSQKLKKKSKSSSSVQS